MTKPQIQGLEHIQYEVERLRESFGRLKRNLRPEVLQSEVNDQLELTLLHARNIIDFFEYSRTKSEVRPKKAQKDDLIAEDYGWPVQSLRIDRKIKTRIDKEVAHLTYSRCGKSQEEKGWRLEDFIPVLIREAELFLEKYNNPNQQPKPTPQSGVALL